MTAKQLVWPLVLVACGRSGAPTSEEVASTVADGSGSGAPTSTTRDPTSPTTSDGMSGQEDGSSAGDTSAGSTSGSTDVPVDELSDEFDDPATLERWTIRDQAEGDPPTIEDLSVADGRLRIRPLAGGWYGDYVGAMLWKAVDGDFIVEAHVEAVSRADGSSPPGLPFNSGGLILRDPASAPGQENWVTNNVGFQSANVATEGKTTVDSQSELFLLPGIHHGRLRLCRTGATIVLARQLDGETSFTETHRFERPDLPLQLQVGMMANGWNSTGSDPDLTRAPDVDALFDYVRFWRPVGEGDCLQ